jgi:TolA-binding protein
MECNTRALCRLAGLNRLLLLAAISLISTGCATMQPAPPAAAPAPEDPRVGELQKQLDTLKGKLESLEFKLATVNDKVDAARTSIDTLGKTREPEVGAVEVRTPIVDQATASSPSALSTVSKPAGDPHAGFVSDSAVASYRKAMVLFEAGRNAEAILGFTQFLDQNADHPWAGSAQYHVGMAYSAQKECKLAIQELSRVLTSYDRSPHVPDALAELVRCEDELKLKQQAAQHRQLLLSLYPNAPAARRTIAPKALTETKTETAPAEAAGVGASAPLPDTAPATKDQTEGNPKS